MAVIINADDLGISEEVNAAIFDLMERGAVTSATLIANAPAFESAALRARSFPSCSFRIHLNASEFHPLTRHPDLRPLLDGTGCFHGDAIRATTITSALKRAVFEEWSAQISRLIGLGLKPTHIDSHHHVHTIPSLFPVLKRLQARYAIRKVRISKNIYGSRQSVSPQVLVKKRLWNLALKHIYRTRTTNGFTSFIEYHELIQNGSIDLRASGNRRKNATVELMVHPGNSGEIYRNEIAILHSGWLEAAGISKTTYMEL